MTFRKVIHQLFHDQTGATAVEYGLIVAMIVIAIIAVVNEVAANIIETWSFVETSVTTV